MYSTALSRTLLASFASFFPYGTPEQNIQGMNQVFSQEVYIHVLRFALQFFTFNWKQNFAFPNGKYSLTAWYICNIQSCLTRRTAVVLHEMVLKFGQFWNFHDLIGWNENDGRQEFTRIDGSRRKLTKDDESGLRKSTRVDKSWRERTRGNERSMSHFRLTDSSSALSLTLCSQTEFKTHNTGS